MSPSRSAVAVPVLFVLLGAVAVACGSSKDDPGAPITPGIEAGPPGDTGVPATDGGKEQTEIVFDKDTSFGERSCTLKGRVDTLSSRHVSSRRDAM